VISYSLGNIIIASIAVYLTLGLLLVFSKTPIKKYIDREINTIDIRLVMNNQTALTKKQLLIYKILLSLTFITIYPLIIFDYIKTKRESNINQNDNKNIIYTESKIQWMKNTISILAAENKYKFGNSSRWKVLLDEMQDGDELYEFCSPPESWKYLAGREGVALVRDGVVVADIVTSMN